MGWKGWVAAVGGLLALLGQYVSALSGYYLIEIGAVLAIVFGVWASMSK
ncbi:MAG: hypothetical protein Q7R52_02320 [archaeon]|nr:hypothetical protein [archaeon]